MAGLIFASLFGGGWLVASFISGLASDEEE